MPQAGYLPCHPLTSVLNQSGCVRRPMEQPVPGQAFSLSTGEATVVLHDRCAFRAGLHQSMQRGFLLAHPVEQDRCQGAFRRLVARCPIGIRGEDYTQVAQLLEQGKGSQSTTPSSNWGLRTNSVHVCCT
jgi:hypothetical protein